MSRIEDCEKKYAKLFGGTPNAGEGNDPELLQILQRFIFGQVSYTGTLDDTMRELITCVILSTYQTLPQLKAHVKAALRVGVTPLEVREAIYGTMPFIGCPKTLNAIAAADEAFVSNGIELPLENAATIRDGERFEKGKEIQYPIYGDEIGQKMNALPAEFAQAIPQYLTEYCFGDFYTRKGLDTQARELLVLVILAAMGGCDAQIKAHVKGCLATGNSAEDLYTAVVHAMPYIGFPRALNAIYAMLDVIGTIDADGK